MQYNKDTKQITLDLSHIHDDNIGSILQLLEIVEHKQRLLLIGFNDDGNMGSHSTLSGVEGAYASKYLDTYLTRIISRRWNEQDQVSYIKRIGESEIPLDLLNEVQEHFDKIERLKNIYGENWKDHQNDED